VTHFTSFVASFSLGHNTASAGGAIYVECQDLGTCAVVFAGNNTNGVLPQLPKVEFTGSKSSAYGNYIATKPSRMEWNYKDDLSIQDSIILIPGQQPLALSVKLFDSVGQPEGSLVVGSEDVIELLICPITADSDGCTFSSASIPALNKGFDRLTGISSVKQDVECALGQTEMAFQVRVSGADHLGKMIGVFVCQHCDIGQRRVLNDAKRTWKCEACGTDKYSANPSNVAESGLCLACPPSATCVHGAPPIFGASKVRGAIEMELLAGITEDYAIRQAVAAKLGVGASKIVLFDQVLQRRNMKKISFELVAETGQMAALTSRLAICCGAVFSSDVKSVSLQTEGEKWEQVCFYYIFV